MVMHPGPMNRGLEISARAADSSRSTVLEQVANGVSIRMAVLYSLLSRIGGRMRSRTPAHRRARPCPTAPIEPTSSSRTVSFVDAAPKARLGSTSPRPAGAPGPRRPPHPPARAGLRAERDRAHRFARCCRQAASAASSRWPTPCRCRTPRSVVEQVQALGERAGYATVRPIGAVTAGLAGERLSEIGAMAQSRAAVRVFSDDGKCVARPAAHAPGARVREHVRRRRSRSTRRSRGSPPARS